MNKLNISLILVCAMIFIAIFAPVIFPHNPHDGDLLMRFQPQSFSHWLGTDHLGRDVLSRLAHGARISIFITFCISALIIIGSFTIGLICGYKGGILDNAIMRVCDVFLTFPTFILALFFISILGVGILNIILAIALTHWAWYARIVRSIVLEIKSQNHIAAAKIALSSEANIIIRHILPVVFTQMIVLITLDLGHIMLHISSLSFLGLGVQAPSSEWGVMIQDSAPFVLEHPSLILYPGLCIFFSVAIFNTLGEALRERFALDTIKKK